MSGEVPEGWRRAALGELCHIAIGGTPSRAKPEYWAADGNGHPWVAISDMREAVIRRTKERITEAGVANSNVKHVASGTVLMSFKLTIGRVAIAGADLFTNEAIAAFLPIEGLDKSFLPYWLAHIVANADTDQAIKGATLNKKKLAALSGDLPPLDEQRRIAEVLRSVDEAIVAKSLVVEQTRTVLSKARDALLQAETSGIGQMHEGWRLATLGEVSLGKGEYGANVSKRDFDAMLPRYVRITDIANDGELIATSLASITLEDAAGYMLEDGDLVFARSGATVGKTFLYDPRYGPCAYAGYLIRFKIDREKADPFFVRSAVQTSHYWEWINTNQRAQAQPNVNAKEYASFPIALPPLEQQQEIVETLRSLQESANQAKADLDMASTLKGSMLSDLLSGRVRVPA
ncbi:restriction endonuclease subunit S [Croceicoccus sp. F390]|uniref:Restriction endonuclease subunit S n=1 Tax=Croceicoccus esteveae TaxID=3075597 RepID=A0ABU2ZKC2_9SPHN|nr:restriction endonuclease subunit S [Croceicoccus sp. F390]MDT0576498.1 restriction endonuclease subunit S [Croceicoccus sp. F390]